MIYLIHDFKYQIQFQHLLQCLSKCLLFLCRLQSCLYQCKMTLPFLYISVLHNHTKTFILLFYWLLISIDLNRLFFSWIFVFFIHFYGYEIFRKKLCCMIVWFWHQIISSSFGCYKFDISMFSHIFHSVSKNYIVH